jgi:hypothetical protein
VKYFEVDEYFLDMEKSKCQIYSNIFIERYTKILFFHLHLGSATKNECERQEHSRGLTITGAKTEY